MGNERAGGWTGLVLLEERLQTARVGGRGCPREGDTVIAPRVLAAHRWGGGSGSGERVGMRGQRGEEEGRRGKEWDPHWGGAGLEPHARRQR